jgi:hypothetical protein
MGPLKAAQVRAPGWADGTLGLLLGALAPAHCYATQIPVNPEPGSAALPVARTRQPQELCSTAACRRPSPAVRWRMASFIVYDTAGHLSVGLR